MENYSTWCKYQNEVAVHLLRWSAGFTEHVWAALCAELAPFLSGLRPQAPDPITAALLLRKQAPIALANFAAKFNISEKQVWALLIDHAEQATISLDRLSDARDQIRQLTAQGEAGEQQRLHTQFLNHTSAISKKQSARAKQSRIKIGDGGNGPALVDVMVRLARDRRYEELSAKELWPVFFDLLNEYDLDPVEDTSTPFNPKYSYDVAGKSRQISFKRFSNVVAETRNEKSR